MNEPDEDDHVYGRQSASSTPAIDSSELALRASPSTVVDVITPEIKRTYLPTQEPGVPDYYETKVSKEEWNDAVSKISTGLTSGITGYGDDIIAKMLIDWKKVSDSFYAQYQRLTNAPKMIRKVDINKFKENLFHFVVHFENFYASLKDSYEAQKKNIDYLDHSFKTFQKTWNWSMKVYQDLTGETLGFFGSLNIAQTHETYLKHLYYTRDDAGFLLFSIYTHEEAVPGSALYQTHIPYGNTDQSFFNKRWLFFKALPNSSTIELIKNRAFIFETTQEMLTTMEPYFGETGIVPFSKGYGLIGFNSAAIDNPEIHKRLIISQKKTAEFMNEISGHRGVAIPDVIPDSLSENPRFADSFHNFADRILEGESSKVVFLPESDLDHMEANYWFLLDLQSQQTAAPQDLDVMYALEWFRHSFPGQTLDEAINEYEKELEIAYTNEEKERLEKVQQEQQERSQMVKTGAHNAPKKRSGKGKKPQKQSTSSLSSKQSVASHLSKREIEENSKAFAHKKIDELKGLAKMKDLKSQTKAIGKIVKFTDYVKMIKVAIQELRTLGANISGELNGSSHGSLSIDNAVMPLHRPHGSKHNMVYGSSARSMLNGLLNMYFEKAAQKSLAEKLIEGAS